MSKLIVFLKQWKIFSKILIHVCGWTEKGLQMPELLLALLATSPAALGAGAFQSGMDWSAQHKAWAGKRSRALLRDLQSLHQLLGSAEAGRYLPPQRGSGSWLEVNYLLESLRGQAEALLSLPASLTASEQEKIYFWRIKGTNSPAFVNPRRTGQKIAGS